MKGLSLNQWQQAGAFFINEGKNIVITFLTAKAVIDGQMTLGSMLAVQYMIGQLNSPVEQMIGFLQSWQNAKISMDRLNEIHTMEDEEPEDKEFQYSLPAAFARQVVGGTTHAMLSAEILPLHKTPLNRAQTSIDGFPTGERLMPDYIALEDRAGISLRNLSFTYPSAGNDNGCNVYCGHDSSKCKTTLSKV